jgi:hypothetical protein
MMHCDEEPAAPDAGIGQKCIMPNRRKCARRLPLERTLAAP